jgi:hypothetical protein
MRLLGWLIWKVLKLFLIGWLWVKLRYNRLKSKRTNTLGIKAPNQAGVRATKTNWRCLTCNKTCLTNHPA